VPDCLSFLWQFKEIFVEQSYRFECENKNPLIYDCGANIGTSCVFFSELYPEAKVIAFEANHKMADVLVQNLKQNNIDNVEVIDKALWIHNDGIEIGMEGADASSIYFPSQRARVGSVRFKELLEKEERVDFIKMDIEGAELEVIKDCGTELKKVNNIFIEYHSFLEKDQKLSVIIGILEKNGFRYFIRPVSERDQPFINRKNKFNPDSDLQLNIFAYRTDS
jgi:FkbM family methyltransferase